MKLFVGLGNPGKKYTGTRHNVGFMTIDALAAKWGIAMTEEKKFKGEFGSTHLNGEKVLLLKPTTYMNLSGESVQLVMDFYDLQDEDILVIYDDLDLDVGHVRLRYKGSSAGHNGIKSIILHMATKEFNRIKIGIGRDKNIPMDAYVLGKFTSIEAPAIAKAIDKTSKACEMWLDEAFPNVMTIINTSHVQ